MNVQGSLIRYSASAGSGKTQALSGFYLSRVLSDPTAYRRILAVTFTNSASAEMKERILKRLRLLSIDGPEGDKERQEFAVYLCKLFPDLYPDMGAALVTVRRNAPLALKNILNDYSRFSVSTIDSFFQRIIRAFAREIDLPSGYEIELEHGELLSDAVDELLAEVSSDDKLRGWITSYVASRLDDNKGWDIRREILEVAGLIFGENFRQLSTEGRKVICDYNALREYEGKVFAVRNGFEKELKRLAARGIEIFSSNGLTSEDFLSKSRGGIGETLSKYARGDVREPGTPWYKGMNEGRYTASGASPAIAAAMEKALSEGLEEVVRSIASLFEKDYPLYLSAQAQVRTIHIIGILGAISEKVRILAHDGNVFLLSDSGELINRLIADDDTPFVYEKIGTSYDHFIIDEFQDTSQIQWKNFLPLISESLSRGNDNLVVGDVKQSIYRWRNSDWRIIHSGVTQAFGEGQVRTIPLEVNFRSRTNIIGFNNLIFGPGGIPAFCDEALDNPDLVVSDIYREAVQQGTSGKPGGMVSVTLFRKDEEHDWKEKALERLPALIEHLQDHGYRADDILFLCRKNDEGKSIISHILGYSASAGEEKNSKYNYEVTSGESLLLERNPAVTLLVACLRYLTDPGNRITRSLMVRSHALATGMSDESAYPGDADDQTSGEIISGWSAHLESLRNESLFGATEKMIAFFQLGSFPENAAFLSAFQDVVLWYSGRYSSDLSSFVRWWDSEGCRKTLGQSDRQEAMRVMTVHKAKGLQSKVVIIPFAAWDFVRQGFSRPLLWVTDVPGAFSPMPVLLPELSSRLDGSLFARQAKLERASGWLDGVNMLYVAFTRATDAMYIMCPEVTQTSAASAAALLNRAFAGLPPEYTRQENGDNLEITVGALPPAEHREARPSEILSSYTVTSREGLLRLRTGGALPADQYSLTGPGNRAYGIMMHELLSRISVQNDIDKAVADVCAAGLMPVQAREEMISKLRTMLSGERVRKWFDGSLRVLTEATILLPGGSARRPDRIMEGDEGLTVIDYKFGEQSERHRKQAAEYRDLLNRMGYANVRSWLWYVSSDRLEEV